MNAPDITITSLSEHPDLVAVIASWHWREWGHTASGETLDDWVTRLHSRAGAEGLPFTLVAEAKSLVGPLGIEPRTRGLKALAKLAFG